MLSAIEGLKVDAPSLAPAVVPITVVILIGLFIMQKQGTGFIGRIFGPVMLGWFVVLAALGIHGIVKAPGGARGAEPALCLRFPDPPGFPRQLRHSRRRVPGRDRRRSDVRRHGAFRPLSDPARLVRGGAARAGAELFRTGGAADHRSHARSKIRSIQLAPDWVHYPLVAFAALATVIASQAIISGVFSLTQQSIQLGFLPRMQIRHTTSDAIGQIYVPLVNWLLAAATLGAVLQLRHLGRARRRLRHRGVAADGDHDAAGGAGRDPVGLFAVIVIAVNGFFFVIDCIFFAANSVKLFEGGWFPLLLAGIVAFLMLTWRSGVKLVERARGKLRQPEEDLIETAVNRCHARLPAPPCSWRRQPTACRWR